MRTIVTALTFCLLGLQAFAGSRTYDCTVGKSKDIIKDRTLTLEIRAEDSMTITTKTTGKLEGTYSEKAKNGSSVYSCDGLVDYAGDQTDDGNILVSQAVESGKNGEITLSVRFTDDDGPVSFYHTDYECKLSK